jgi:transcriptional regulator with XRE-family HTH domain
MIGENLMFWENVGKRIAELRSERNLSQVQFGKTLGISGQYVGRIERGTINISAKLIVKICDETGVSADYLLFGIIEPNYITEALNGLSREQIQIVLEIIKKAANFIRSDGGNEALIKHIFAHEGVIT